MRKTNLLSVGRRVLKGMLLLLVFLFSGMQLAAQNGEQVFKDTPIKEILVELTEKTGYKFVYSDALSVVNTKVDFTIPENADDIRPVLDRLFKGLGVSYKIDGKQVIIAPLTIAPLSRRTEKKVLTGIVTDKSTGETIPGVIVKNTVTGKLASADVLGNFNIEATPGDILEISSIGMEDCSYTVSTLENIVNIEMKPSVVNLSDIVVTGYQTLSKERATGSYAVISQENLKNKIQTGIMSKLDGMIPGLTTYKGVLQIRGKSTILGNSSPLIIVDGFPYEGSINSINPNEVANITVLKDAAAASIYGARSANGVIVITTRGGDTKKTTVEYSGSMTVNYLRDQREYLNLMNSAELVDFQVKMFNIYHNPATSLNPRRSIEPMAQLLYDHEAGKISDSEFNRQLDVFRNTDNRNEYDMMDFTRKTSITQQHNVSLRGGTEKYNYSTSINYTRTDGYVKDNLSDRLGYNIKGYYNFFKWLRADIGVIGSFTRNNSYDGFSATGLYTGQTSYPSYKRYFDDNGNQLQWYSGKSQQEIDRLKNLGLLDETYYPIQERTREMSRSESNYSNIQLGLNFKIIKGLTLDLKYQYETTFSMQKWRTLSCQVQ